jgi:hypothetical protein
MSRRCLRSVLWDRADRGRTHRADSPTACQHAAQNSRAAVRTHRLRERQREQHPSDVRLAWIIHEGSRNTGAHGMVELSDDYP